MEERQHQAKRVLDYHQHHIAEHLTRCERGQGHEKPFRHTLSTSREPRRREEPKEFLVESFVPQKGPLSVKPRMVKPLVRLRRPGALSSDRSMLGTGPMTGRKALNSPRLPPLVYDDIDKSLAGKRLPVAWFADPPSPKLLGRSQSLHEASADEAYREEGAAEPEVPAEVPEILEETFDPPLPAKGVYHLPDGRSEWRRCEVLSYHRGDDRFEVRWLCTTRCKRVTALQLHFHEESETARQRRVGEAEARRDTVEAMLLKEIVVEELSRWQGEISAVSGGGSSVKRIMELAQLKRYEASPEVVQGLIREAAEDYCRSQAKWLLLWRRPDLEEYLGEKPVPLPETQTELDLPELLGLPELPSLELQRRPQPQPPEEPPEPVRPAVRLRTGLASKGRGGVRGNLRPNRKLRNVSSPKILEKAQELAQLSLLGDKSPQSRLLQVFDQVGSLYCDHSTQLYVPTRKREPYSLADFARTLSDGFSRSASYYRVSWPESISLFFITDSGLIKDWTPRSSQLVSRLMEAGLHELCLKNLRRLLELFDFYSRLTADAREGKMLTYIPPPVYQRMAAMDYEQHPLFYIQVTVERNAEVFIPGMELQIESCFACADTKSLESLFRKKKFGEVVQHLTHRWKLDTNQRDLLPDGAAHGGAPSAHNLAVARNTAQLVTQVAGGLGGEESSDDERPSVDELLTTPAPRPQDVKLLFEGAGLSVKLTDHPTEFREVLGDHFRKVLELTEKYSTIDGSLQQDGEVKQRYLASLSSVQSVDPAEYEEKITSCFFEPLEVVYEVRKYHALLERFSHQEEQIRKMLPFDFSQVAAEGAGGDEEEETRSERSAFSEERFGSGLISSIQELREHLDRIDAWAEQLNESQDLPERHLGLFVVDVSPLRKALMAMCACCRLRLLGVVQRWVEDGCVKLKNRLQAKSGEIIMSPKHPDELHSTILAVKSLEPFFLEETAPVLASIRQMFEALESRCHQVPRTLVKRWYECIHAVPDLRDRAEKWQNVFRKDLRGKFNVRIAEKAKLLTAEAEECRQVLEEYALKVSLQKAEFYYNKMHTLQDRVAKLQEQVEKQHVHEEMMEMPLSQFPGLAATAEQIVPLLELWFLAHDWSQWQEEILFGEFSKIDPEGVELKLDHCTEIIERLEEVFEEQPQPREVLQSLSLELTELGVLLPVIVCLRNPGLREHHWTQIGEAIGQTIQATQMKEISLSGMNEKFPFVAHLEQIQAISETASKEMIIEDELRRMQEQWNKLHFQFQPTGVFGEGEDRVEEESSIGVPELHHAEVWELITEQAAKVRLLGHRAHAAVHEKALVEHDRKLKQIGELCDWLYEDQYGYVQAREHILQEGLVKDLMQRDSERSKEWKRFFEVEKLWQGIMAHLRSSGTWLVLLEVPKITAMCREAAGVMEHILRTVHDVLDLRRAKVPNLYRLSDPQLLRAIRYGHCPSEPAIRHALPGIMALDVSSSVMEGQAGQAVRGLLGDTGEYLSLPEEVLVQEGMQLEDWLPKLIAQTSHLLRWSMFGLMLSSFNAADPRLLDEKYPLQVRSAALDLAFTTEVEALLSENAGAPVLQTRRIGLSSLIDQIQERRLQAADSEDRGVDFEQFMATSSEEEDEVVEHEPTDSEEEEEPEEETDEEDEEEEPTSDESVSEDDLPAGRMAARKAVHLEPPPFVGNSNRSSHAEGDKRKDGKRLLPEALQRKIPWRLLRISITAAQQQLLRWREIFEQLESERTDLLGKTALTSYRWLTTLRHYMRSKAATNSEEFQSYVDRSQYLLSMGGFDLGYAWQYLGNIGSQGRMYWDAQTERGQLVMVHSFATARGVMTTGDGREEASAALARQLGMLQERIFVNWRTSLLAVWRHLEGAVLAKTWLSISIESTAHSQVLGFLAQELHGHVTSCRMNLSQGAPSSWVNLECHQALLAPPKLPLLLLQAFRPHALPTPGLDALCQLWLLASSLRPSTAKSLAPLAAFAWRFCEATGVLRAQGQESLSLWQLRILCETTVKLAVQVRLVRGRKGSVAGSKVTLETLSARTETSSLAVGSMMAGSMATGSMATGSMAGRSMAVGSMAVSGSVSGAPRRPSAAQEELESEQPRRTSGALQDHLAPGWVRACLFRAFQMCCFDTDFDGALSLKTLLRVSEEELAQVDAAQRPNVAAKTALEALGLVPRSKQLQALQRMSSWVNQCHSETDLAVGMPSSRGVLVLGSVAVGKSSMVDALARSGAWQLIRLNSSSLALDAADTLQRPVAGTSRLLLPSAATGLLESARPRNGKVLVHVDGELPSALQEAFLALQEKSEPLSHSRRHQGLQFSRQSCMAPAERLAVALEMSDAASLGPDLLTRCGVIHLGEEEPAEDLDSLMQSWCHQLENRFEDGNLLYTVQSLYKAVLLPLMLLVYGEELQATGVLAEAAKKLKELSSSTSSRTQELQWTLPQMPSRVLVLRVQQAFQDIYGHFVKSNQSREEEEEPVSRARTETGDTQASARSRRSYASPHASARQTPRHSPRASPRHSRSARKEVDDTEEPRGGRMSFHKQLAKKASSLLLLPDADAPKKELLKWDSEVTLAFVYALLMSFKSLLHERASSALEELTLSLLKLSPSQLALPEFSIFDSIPDEHLQSFCRMESILKEPEFAGLDAFVYVPTQQSKRFLAMSQVLQRSRSSVFLLGPPGSGKSLTLSQMMAQLPLREMPRLPAAFAAHCGQVTPTTGFGARAELLYMSATQWMQPGLWERSLQSLTRSSQHGLRPRLYSWCVYVVDDCHCALEPLQEAWRFNLERQLVHFPGAAQTRKGLAGKKLEPEREAGFVSVQHLEDVMLVLAGRSSCFASRLQFLRHSWLCILPALEETELRKIVGENVSQVFFAKEMAPAVTEKKMLYVEFLYSVQAKLQETQASSRLITPHVLFRLFKSLLSPATEHLSDLTPEKFHKFLLHELLRETVDRLPAPRQRGALLEVARLQRSIFGGLDRYGELRAGPTDDASEASHDEEEQLKEICASLQSLHYSSLEAVKDMMRQPRLQRSNNYGEIPDVGRFREHLRFELRRGWERPKAMHSQVSPLLWSLSSRSTRESSFQEMQRRAYEPGGVEKHCAGLEPRHLLLSDEYISQILAVGRHFELSSAKLKKVWGREAGQLLVLAPCVPVALCLLRGAAHLQGLSFAAPRAMATEGADGPSDLGDELKIGEAFRSWIKEKLLASVRNHSNTVLCIPPEALTQENLGILHEILSQGGPPPWYSEREVKDCEDAVAALPAKSRLVPQEDEEASPTLEIFWAEALGRVHFLLLMSNDSAACSASSGVSSLDAWCPQMLHMAVLQMAPPFAERAYYEAAKVHLSSPILDVETWQPDTDFHSPLDPALLAEAAGELVRVVHITRPPRGMAPAVLPAAQGATPLQPSIPARSAWDGEAIFSGLRPVAGGLGDVGDVLFLAQGLCRFKGQEMARQHQTLKDAQNLLQGLQESAATSDAAELQKQLAEVTRRASEAQETLEAKARELQASEKELEALLEEVVHRCTRAAKALEDAEDLVTKSKQEVESARFQLLNFSKQDGVEFRKAVAQHCANETPTSALLELFALLMRQTPSRGDELRSLLSEPSFATKFAATCAVDTETFPKDLVQPMERSAAAVEGFDDIKALTSLANMALPAAQYTSTLLQLPEMRRELQSLEEERRKRQPELQDLEASTQILRDEAQLLQVLSEDLQKELQKVEVTANNATSQRSRTLMMGNGLRQDRVRWGWKLQELGRRLQCLVGDALLSAAAVELLGPFGPEHREDLLQHWKDVLEHLSVPYSKDLDLAAYWMDPTTRYRLREAELPKDVHLEEGLVFACLQASKWPVLYDPDHLAANFLQNFFPGAVRLSMGSSGFQKDLITALSRPAQLEVLGQVILIENAYLPALHDLTELLKRRDVVANLQGQGVIQLSGAEDTVVHVDPRTVLIFITEMGEPWNSSGDFQVIDFQLTRESNGFTGPLLELVTESVCAKATPSIHQELKRLLPEFLQLMEEWNRQDEELLQKLAHHHRNKDPEVKFPSEEQLRETMGVKMNLESIGRRMLKARDGEVKLLRQRSSNDLLVAAICSMASAAAEIFDLCPSSGLALSGSWRLCAELLPEPVEDRQKSRDYGTVARRTVLAGLWARLAPGLPRQFALSAALRLSMASALPPRPLQEILGNLLWQCPAANPQVLQKKMDSSLCFIIQAILQGQSLSEALRERPSRSRSKPSEERSGSKTMASVSRSVMSLGPLAFEEDSEEEEEEEEADLSNTEKAPTRQGEPPDSADLLQQLFCASKGHWSCSSKQIFLARFAYFQESFRSQLEQCTETPDPSRDTWVLSELFRLGRRELFGIDERYLEELLMDVPTRNQAAKEFLQRRSTRNLLPVMDEVENTAEGGADTLQLFALLLHFGAGHGPFGPWALQLHLESQALQLADRLEESVSRDPVAWARWAELVAAGRAKGSSSHALAELPLLASLPSELLSTFMQSVPSSITLKTISGAAFLQMMLFPVLASHSLSAVLHGAEALVTGAMGLPLRRPCLSRLLEHRHPAQPVLCLCESEASVVDSIHRMSREAGRKLIQLSLTDLVSNTTETRKAGLPAGERLNDWNTTAPSAECAVAVAAVMELLEECKDVGYWLVLHLHLGSSQLSAVEAQGVEIASFQLLEWIWFNCSTPSFHSMADEKFRLFLVIDSRLPVALPSWLFRSGRGLCLFDTTGAPSLRSWMEKATDVLSRKPPPPGGSMVLPSSPNSSKANSGLKNLADLANASELQQEGKMARVIHSLVLSSKLAQPNFPLKLQTAGQRLAMLVLACACDCFWARCVLKTVGGARVAELVEDLSFDVTLRSVDLLEVFAPLLQQAQRSPLGPDGPLPGPASSPYLYNLLRQLRSVHLSKLPEIFTAPSENQQKGTMEASKRSSAARSSQLIALPRKTRKNLDTQDVDENLWYHDDPAEKESPWKVFAQVVEAMDRVINAGEQPGEAEEQLQEAVKMLPLLEPFSFFRSAGAIEIIFSLALSFSQARQGRLKLPPPSLQAHEESRDPAESPEESLPDEDAASEAPRESQRKVSGVEILQFHIPDIEGEKSTSEAESEGVLERPLSALNISAALVEMLKATRSCVESGDLPKAPTRPEGHETALQAEWRRQRCRVGCWAWEIHQEAADLLRGLEGDELCPKMAMKLRQLLQSAEVWVARPREEEHHITPPGHLPNCPMEVSYAAKSPAAATLPVPPGWQTPRFCEKANFGAFLLHLAGQLEVYRPGTVPRSFHVAELAELEPLLLSLRLCLARRQDLQVEQTCLLFFPTDEVTEDWDELDMERPPAFKTSSSLPEQLVSALKLLKPPEKEKGKEDAAPSSPRPSVAGPRPSMGTTFAKSVRKVQMMATLGKTRRSSARPSTKKIPKDSSFVGKENSAEDLILRGLLADGAVWSSQGLHVDSNVGMTRLPPLRVLATTLRAAEFVLSEAFPQAIGCMNLFVHRLFGNPWPAPEGLLPRSSVELCTIRLPFWSKPSNRWQPVMLLDELGPFPPPGHVRGGEGNEDVVVRPYALRGEAMLALAGPPLRR